MPTSYMDHRQKCRTLKLLWLDKELLFKSVLMQKPVDGKAPHYLKDPMISSELLYVHGNKQLLPEARIDISKTSLSFSGSLAWNDLSLDLTIFNALKKKKAFPAFINSL